jgi:hypothetical protein
MAQGVYTRMKRISFVNGWLTGGTDPADGSVECGDGTGYPMEVTLDQIAEIFHRVKDAYFTEGSIFQTEFSTILTINASTSAPIQKTTEIAYPFLGLIRGYTAQEFQFDANYFNEPYDAGAGTNFMDISDKERGIHLNWLMMRPDYISDNIGNELINAFSFGSITNSTIYPTDTVNYFNAAGSTSVGCVGKVYFNGEVAIIKTDPENSDYAPSNRYFIGLEFSMLDYSIAPIGGGTWIESPYFGTLGNPIEVCRYVLRLSNADVSCPVYMSTDVGTDHGGTDFIHEAVEWFPYQDGNGSVWNPATGLPA